MHHRRTIHLPGYDYAKPGGYFATMVTQDRALLFGDIIDGEMRLNEFGIIADETWRWLAGQYPYVDLDVWTIMPNHVHGILMIKPIACRGGSIPGGGPAPIVKPLGQLIGAFKTVSAKRINLARCTPGVPVWQRNYYEHIIRDEKEMDAIRRYIQNNPSLWDLDREKPG